MFCWVLLLCFVIFVRCFCSRVTFWAFSRWLVLLLLVVFFIVVCFNVCVWIIVWVFLCVILWVLCVGVWLWWWSVVWVYVWWWWRWILRWWCCCVNVWWGFFWWKMCVLWWWGLLWLMLGRWCMGMCVCVLCFVAYSVWWFVNWLEWKFVLKSVDVVFVDVF